MTPGPLRLFFRLAFGITWGVGALALVLGHAGWPRALGVGSPLIFLAGYGPSIAGLLCAWRADGRAGIVHLLRSALPGRASLAWYPALLVGYPALGLLSCWLLGTGLNAAVPWSQLAVLLVVSLLLDTGPLGEEFGWRGFALPVLLSKYRPVIAGLLLGLIWAAWHLPTFFMPSMPQSSLSLPLFVIHTVAMSVAMTGLFVRSGGRLDLMVLLHLLGNFWAAYVPLTALTLTNLILAGLAFAGRRIGRRQESPRDPHE